MVYLNGLGIPSALQEWKCRKTVWASTRLTARSRLFWQVSCSQLARNVWIRTSDKLSRTDLIGRASG